jgi:hypothetical protein
MATVPVEYTTAIIPVEDSIAVRTVFIVWNSTATVFGENRIAAVRVENNTAITLWKTSLAIA